MSQCPRGKSVRIVQLAGLSITRKTLLLLSLRKGRFAALLSQPADIIRLSECAANITYAAPSVLAPKSSLILWSQPFAASNTQPPFRHQYLSDPSGLYLPYRFDSALIGCSNTCTRHPTLAS